MAETTEQPRGLSSPSENFDEMKRRKTSTMSQFFRENDLDKATQDLLLQYDEDGNGVFTKAEVTMIIADLQEQFRKNEELVLSNAMLKKMLMAAVVFFFLLVASIFGLSFAVASLTKDTSVNTGTGTLYTKDGTTVIATDSRAEVYQVEAFDFGGCMSQSEAEILQRQVVEGKNVLIQSDDKDGSKSLHYLSPSGSTYNATTGVTCFPIPSGHGSGSQNIAIPGNGTGAHLCVGPDLTGQCNHPDVRRRLSRSRDNDPHRELGVDCTKKPDHPNCLILVCLCITTPCNC